MGQVHFCASARLYYLEDSLLCFEFQPCIKDICQYMCMSWSIPWRGMLKCQFRNATLQTLTRNCWVQYEVKMAERIQPNLTYPMGIGSWRALILLGSYSLRWHIEVASLHRPCNKDIQIMQWKPTQGLILLTFTCSTYKVIRKKYIDNVSATFH